MAIILDQNGQVCHVKGSSHNLALQRNFCVQKNKFSTFKLCSSLQRSHVRKAGVRLTSATYTPNRSLKPVARKVGTRSAAKNAEEAQKESCCAANARGFGAPRRLGELLCRLGATLVRTPRRTCTRANALRDRPVVELVERSFVAAATHA